MKLKSAVYSGRLRAASARNRISQQARLPGRLIPAINYERVTLRYITSTLLRVYVSSRELSRDYPFDKRGQFVRLDPVLRVSHAACIRRPGRCTRKKHLAAERQNYRNHGGMMWEPDGSVTHLPNDFYANTIVARRSAHLTYCPRHVSVCTRECARFMFVVYNSFRSARTSCAPSDRCAIFKGRLLKSQTNKPRSRFDTKRKKRIIREKQSSYFPPPLFESLRSFVP